MPKTRRFNDRGGVVTPSEKPYGREDEAAGAGPPVLTVAQLRAQAEEAGVEPPKRATKAQIVAAIEAAATAAEEPEETADPETESED